MNTLTETGIGSERLRVLMVTPFHGDGGGVGSVSKELTNKLLEREVEVDVFHWWPNFNDPALIDARRGRMALESVDELLAMGRNYDLMHFQSSAYSDRVNGGLSKILARYQVPIIYTIHSLASYHGQIMNNVNDMRLNVQDQEEMMHQAARVILLTDDLVDIALKHHPHHEQRFVVTPNGTNLPSDSFDLRTEVTRLTHLFNPDGTSRILLYVGRISTEKGIYELIEAFPEIKRLQPDCKLVVAGNKPDDPNVKKIKRALTKSGLIEQRDFDFAGWVDGQTKAALYELAEFVIMPSYYEHMPLTALEAMARRKPVIISDIASLRLTFHMDQPEQCCVWPIKQIKDAKAVVEAVDAAFSSPEQVAQVVERAHAKILQRYNWDAVVDHCLALYHEQLPPERVQELHWMANERAERRDAAHQSQLRDSAQMLQQAEQASAVGQHALAFDLLQDAKESAPDLPAQSMVSAAMARLGQHEIARLRSALAEKLCDPDLLARMQLVAECYREAMCERSNESSEEGSLAAIEVSVLMPLFLRENQASEGLRYLREAVDSVMQQSFAKPFQLIIIDDRSEIDVSGFLVQNYPDMLREIVQEDGEVLYHCAPNALMARKSIKLILKADNSGNDVTPRNLGILDALLSGSRYLTHCDSDDRRPPGFLQTSYDYLQAHPDTDFLHGRHVCIDERGKPQVNSKIDPWYNYARSVAFGIDQKDAANEGKSKRNTLAEVEWLDKENWVHGGTIMYRSNVVWRVGLEHLAPTVRYGADHIYWKNISRVASMDYLSTILTENRWHSGSMSQGGR